MDMNVSTRLSQSGRIFIWISHFAWNWAFRKLPQVSAWTHVFTSTSIIWRLIWNILLELACLHLIVIHTFMMGISMESLYYSSSLFDGIENFVVAISFISGFRPGCCFKGFSSQRITEMIPVYVECVIHGGSNMVPWAQLREPIWENADWLDFGIGTFILVIHLSKVEQTAIFFPFHPSSRVLNNVPLYWASSPFVYRRSRVWSRQTSFFQLCSRDWPQSHVHAQEGNRHVFLPAGVVLLVFGEV